MIGESLERMIATLPSASGGMQPTHNLAANVYIARSPTGTIQIILDDCEAPNQTISLKRATLQSGVNFDSRDGGQLSNCLVLEFDTGVDAFAVAKIAEHLSNGSESTVRTGEHLVHTIDVFRSLVENDTSAWNFKRMLGLWGELAVLERLLSLAEGENEQLCCVRAWQSNGVHCQDFVMSAARAAFDVKTTSRIHRMHDISSADQVGEREHDESHLVSLMVRPVGEEEGWTALDLVTRIENTLSGPAAILFNRRLQKLNPDPLVCGTHHLRERHNRPMRMIPALEVPGVSQFTPLPEGVPSLSWPVTLSEGGMAGPELDTILKEWIANDVEVREDE
jgi:hypothetical protein